MPTTLPRPPAVPQGDSRSGSRPAPLRLRRGFRPGFGAGRGQWKRWRRPWPGRWGLCCGIWPCDPPACGANSRWVSEPGPAPRRPCRRQPPPRSLCPTEPRGRRGSAPLAASPRPCLAAGGSFLLPLPADARAGGCVRFAAPGIEGSGRSSAGSGLGRPKLTGSPHTSENSAAELGGAVHEAMPSVWTRFGWQHRAGSAPRGWLRSGWGEDASVCSPGETDPSSGFPVVLNLSRAMRRSRWASWKGSGALLRCRGSSLFIIHLDKQPCGDKMRYSLFRQPSCLWQPTLLFYLFIVSSCVRILLWSTLLRISVFLEAKASGANKVCLCLVLCHCWEWSWLQVQGCEVKGADLVLHNCCCVVYFLIWGK